MFLTQPMIYQRAVVIVIVIIIIILYNHKHVFVKNCIQNNFHSNYCFGDPSEEIIVLSPNNYLIFLIYIN